MRSPGKAGATNERAALTALVLALDGRTRRQGCAAATARKIPRKTDDAVGVRHFAPFQ